MNNDLLEDFRRVVFQNKFPQELYTIEVCGNVATIYQQGLLIGKANMDTLKHAIDWAIQQKNEKDSKAQIRSIAYAFTCNLDGFREAMQRLSKQLNELSQKAMERVSMTQPEGLEALIKLADAGSMTEFRENEYGYTTRNDYFNELAYLRHIGINIPMITHNKYHRSRDRLRRIK